MDHQPHWLSSSRGDQGFPNHTNAGTAEATAAGTAPGHRAARLRPPRKARLAFGWQTEPDSHRYPRLDPRRTRLCAAHSAAHPEAVHGLPAVSKPRSPHVVQDQGDGRNQGRAREPRFPPLVRRASQRGRAPSGPNPALHPQPGVPSQRWPTRPHSQRTTRAAGAPRARDRGCPNACLARCQPGYARHTSAMSVISRHTECSVESWFPFKGYMPARRTSPWSRRPGSSASRRTLRALLPPISRDKLKSWLLHM
jgi:hypothetical protein